MLALIDLLPPYHPFLFCTRKRLSWHRNRHISGVVRNTTNNMKQNKNIFCSKYKRGIEWNEEIGGSPLQMSLGLLLTEHPELSDCALQHPAHSLFPRASPDTRHFPRWGETLLARWLCHRGWGWQRPSRISTSESSPPTPIQPLQATAASRAARRPPPSPAARRRARTILICVRGNDGRQAGISLDRWRLLHLSSPRLLGRSKLSLVRPTYLPLLSCCRLLSCGEEEEESYPPPPRQSRGWRGD